MFARLSGLETEYALRFEPADPDGPRPSNRVLYEAFRHAIAERVRTRPSRRTGGLFTENGGAFYYEAKHAWSGLLEGCTPECRGPSELLLYQRANDALLREAIPAAQAQLEQWGVHGELGLLKNARDAQGHSYGTQENYELDVATGGALALYRLGIVVLFPLTIAAALVSWGLVLILLSPLLLLLLAGCAIIGPFWLASRAADALQRRKARREAGSSAREETCQDAGRHAARHAPDGEATSPRQDESPDTLREWITSPGSFERALSHVLHLGPLHAFALLLLPWTALVNRLGFRRVRRASLAFFVSRPILSGAGNCEEGAFRLSERALGITSVARVSPFPGERPIFDTSAIMKRAVGVSMGRIGEYWLALRRKQRLQVNLSDSNMAPVAEYLKVATALLVLDMIEAGALEDAPLLADPLGALAAFNADPSLQIQVPLKDGRRVSALDLQWDYCERAERFVREAPAAPPEAYEVVRLWRDALTRLVDARASLVGSLDWVTKRYLLEHDTDILPDAVRKKIDLKYHELGCGYFEALERAGHVPSLLIPGALERAMSEPPANTPAFARGQLVRRLALAGEEARIDWEAVRVGSRFRATIIRLADHRAPPPPGEE